MTSTTARVWLRSARAGRVEVEYWIDDARGFKGRAEAEVRPDAGADGTLGVRIPCAGEAPLEPSSRYAFRAVHAASGDLIGAGRFETAPVDAGSAPARFSIAFMSCNQPFDDHGSVRATAAEMLRACEACLDDHSARLVLTLGDQMYTDYPPPLSLFDPAYFDKLDVEGSPARIEDCSAEQVRVLLHQRYRHFWNLEGWRRLHARYPCCAILDDHEIADNWGCDPEHATRKWRGFIEGARAAYYDYQGSRVSEPHEVRECFDYEVEYGPAAAYVLDLRSNRTPGNDARIYSPRQLEGLRDFLGRHAKTQVILLVLSVPLVHLPRWAARTGKLLLAAHANEDFSDRWSTAGHIRDRDALLRLLHAHQKANPEQRIMLLSGDIHIACAQQIVWDDGTAPLTQLVASGITNEVSAFTQYASKVSMLANRRVHLTGGPDADVRPMAGSNRNSRNPYTKLNFGLLEFRRGADGRFAVRFLIYGHHGEQPVCVYRSGWL